MTYKLATGKTLHNKDFVEYSLIMWIDYKSKIQESGRAIDFNAIDHTYRISCLIAFVWIIMIRNKT